MKQTPLNSREEWDEWWSGEWDERSLELVNVPLKTHHVTPAAQRLMNLPSKPSILTIGMKNFHLTCRFLLSNFLGEYFSLKILAASNIHVLFYLIAV